jgi:tyrosyl-tRNA synthetase
MKYLKMLTFLPLGQIAEMESWRGARVNAAKEILAREITALIHGADAAAEAQETARALFSSGAAADMPETSLAESDFTDGFIDILAVLQKSGLVSSRSEARRAVEQGGVEAGGEKISDIAKKYAPDEFSGAGLVVRRGKKSYKRVRYGG